MRNPGIVPRGIAALGYTLQLPSEDRFLMISDEIRGRIVTLLGGRAAEELIFSKVSTGASDDIQKATDLAERFVTLYGMSDKLGPITFERVQQQFLNNFSNPRRSISEKIAEQIDQEVKKIMDGAHQLALVILRENQKLLKEVADILLEKEVLEGEELSTYLASVKIPTIMNQWLNTGKIFEESFVANGKRT